MRIVISLAALLLPWPLRRLVLVYVLGYAVDKTARIGLSLICPNRLEMGPGSRIGHLTICKPGIQLLKLGESASIGNLNWIGGVPISSSHFQEDRNRIPGLILEDHAAISNRHYIDCTAAITIGRFSTVAGVHSIILTHSLNLKTCKQGASPVTIGEYCFLGAGVVILSGARLPNYSILGANSLLNKDYTEPYQLYAGNPARAIKTLSSEDKYFLRTTGFVD